MANPNIKRAVRVALIAASTGSAALYGAATVAQEAELEQVIVTGSRIPQPNLEGTSPVSLISNADIKVQGTQQVEDLINNMPQVFAGQGGNYSNGASGTATVNLRGLGSARTLVLVNGRRMVAGSPRGPEAPDLNQIPAPLIERVEVLTGGASAVYGSDAVAGVVNFIMKDNFEGVQLDGNYSFYNHDNSSDVADIVKARGFKAAPNTVGADGDSYELSLLMGSNFADDKGNATFFVGYRETDALLQSERDYSSCSLGSTAAGFACGGSSTSYPGRFYNDDFSASYSMDPATGAVRPWSTARDAYNFGPLNYWQRPDERWSASAFIHYDLTDSARVYSEFMFHDDRTKSQIAPSGMFGVTVPVACDGSNPLLTAQWLTALCFGGTDDVTATVLRRNIEGGGRQDDIRHTSYRGVVGVKGEVLDNWSYDVSASYSTVIFSETYLNDFSITRSQRAMDVVDDGAGNPVCRSVVDGSDPTCVPYNIWTLGGVTPEALAYLQIPLFSKGETELRTITATMASDLGEYGIKLPTARDGIGVAFGVQYAEQALDFNVDPNFASGDGAGQGGPTIGTGGGYNNVDLFAEVRVPLVQDVFMADSLLLNASYRYSDYSNPINEQANTYGVGLEWAPIEDVKFRGSYQRAVRAPSIIELFAAQSIGLYDNDLDPCAGPVAGGLTAAGYDFATCAQTGVTAGVWGLIPDNPAGQYNGFFGGNPELDPETADSYTVGFVLQPSFLEGFSLTVDYFDIKVEDVISTISPTIVLNQCLETGGLCDLIHRDAAGSLWLATDAYIEATNLNIGSLTTNGVDIDVRYTTDIGAFGTLGLSLVGTYLMELVTEPIAGAGSIGDYDCAGLYGSDCGTPNPEWRHTARVTWGTPWNVDLSLGWRYYDEVMIDNADSNPLITGGYNDIDKFLDAQNYIDIAATWSFMESYEVRFGINNVLDDDPPLSSQVGSGAGNGNTYPQVYDALGRYVFMGLTAKF